MILTFKDSEAERIFYLERSRKLPHEIQLVALRKLRMLDNAATLSDLMVPPANRLEKLRGNRSDQYSVRINERWRICFEWKSGNALNVEIVDYH